MVQDMIKIPVVNITEAEITITKASEITQINLKPNQIHIITIKKLTLSLKKYKKKLDFSLFNHKKTKKQN
jgi:hypothetical protein